jgi:hypothetical protein
VCQYCTGDMEAALKDANKAADTDPRAVGARAVRARILQQSAQECVQWGAGEEPLSDALLTGLEGRDISDEMTSADDVFLNEDTNAIAGPVIACPLWLQKNPHVLTSLRQQRAVAKSEAARKRESSLLGSDVSSAILYASAQDAMFGESMQSTACFSPSFPHFSLSLSLPLSLSPSAAVAAFLQSGSTDQALAGIAEDCARNASRYERERERYAPVCSGVRARVCVP